MTTVELVSIILSVVGLAMTLVLTLVGWQLKQGKDNMATMAANIAATAAALQALAREQTELRTVLIGVNGNNGVNSEVKRLRSKIHRLSSITQRAIARLDLWEQKQGKNIMEPPHADPRD